MSSRTKIFQQRDTKINYILKKANIYHTCPKKAFKFLNKIHDNPKIWWNKKKPKMPKICFVKNMKNIQC